MTNRLSTNPVAGQQGQPPEICLFDPHAEAVPDDPVVPPPDDFDFDADTDLDTGDDGLRPASRWFGMSVKLLPVPFTEKENCIQVRVGGEFVRIYLQHKPRTQNSVR